MSGIFVDANAPRFNGKATRRPEDLPHGMVPPPSEIIAQVAAERTKFPADVYNDTYAKLILDDWTLAYYYEGLDVAYRSVPGGVEVLAVGADEIGKLVKGKGQEELLTFCIKEL
ncbi:MAG TPA: hypothetical protein VGY58_02330 [Gemmataceae bacterium]|jgi:hypothetical protein|nr:hypothetical protein [Gemmataceae bacterium]